MAYLTYKGICEFCPAALLCATRNFTAKYLTRCVVCGEVCVAYIEPGENKVRAINLDGFDCPDSYGGSYCVCDRAECTDLEARKKYAQHGVPAGGVTNKAGYRVYKFNQSRKRRKP